jgi:hypothetical protein
MQQALSRVNIGAHAEKIRQLENRIEDFKTQDSKRTEVSKGATVGHLL